MNDNKEDYLNFKSIEDTISKIKPELEFIASIPKNHKPCFSTKTTIDKNAWLVTFKRRWSGEKGEKGVEYVAKILKQCVKIEEQCINLDPEACLEKQAIGCLKMTEDTPEQLFRDFENTLNDFIDWLTKACTGLSKLIVTYEDQKVISKQYSQIRFQIIQIVNDLSNWLYDFLSTITDLVQEKLEKERQVNNYYDDIYVDDYYYDGFDYYDCYNRYNKYNPRNNNDQPDNNIFGKTYSLFSNFFNDAIDLNDTKEQQRKIIDMLKSDNPEQVSFFDSEGVRMMGTPE